MKLALAIVLALTPSAFADPADDKANEKANDKANDKADELFKQGKKLMAEKRLAEACPKLEKSFAIDPQIGTELNIGRCYEDWGKLGRAYRAYTDAAKRADDARDARAPKIKELIARLEPNVPRLVIRVPAGAETAGLQVAIDGVAVPDFTAPQLVDPGPKAIEYALGSGPRKTKLVPMERGATSEIMLDLPRPRDGRTGAPAASSKAVASSEPGEVAPAQKVGHGQRVAGVAIASAGVVAFGVGSYLALAARSKYHDALSAHCMGMTDACDPQGLTDTHDARSQANTATIIGGAGLAALAAGIVVYVLAPHAAAEPSATEHALYLAPTATGTGLAIGGAF